MGHRTNVGALAALALFTAGCGPMTRPCDTAPASASSAQADAEYARINPMGG